jgi:hypothetical protein
MANAQEIEFFIDENGDLKVHAKGIKGKRCMPVLDELAKGLGTEKSRELTPEYYEQETKPSDKTRIQGQ